MQGSEDNYQSNMKYFLIMSADPDGDDIIYHDGHWISESNTKRIQH